MHIEEAHCTKLFYYVYLCKFNVSLFKKVSLAPPLIAPWSMCFNPAVCMKSGGRQGWWIMNGLKQTSTKRKSAEVSLIFNDPPWSLKLSNIKYCRVPSVVVPLVSPLINSGCLLIRWTVYSICSLSSCSDSIRLYLIAYFLHINNLILPPTPVPHLFTVLVKHFPSIYHLSQPSQKK